MFCPRSTKGKAGRLLVSFLPAASNEAIKDMGQKLRSWRLNRRSDRSLEDLARWINPVLRGWITYFGRFYPSRLGLLLRRINQYLVRWARRKYKRLRGYWRAKRWLARVAQREPTLFAHWRLVRPDGWDNGSRVS